MLQIGRLWVQAKASEPQLAGLGLRHQQGIPLSQPTLSAATSSKHIEFFKAMFPFPALPTNGSQNEESQCHTTTLTNDSSTSVNRVLTSG
jgi:hypothetical protein